MKKIISILGSVMLAALAIGNAAYAAGVDVYGEGTINGNQLKVYVYADVNVDQLISYGVSLNYDAEELSVVDVQKDPDTMPYTSNTTKWHLGDSTAVYRNNPEPDTASPGEIIIIGGKLDPENPQQGVGQGARVLLAEVTFGPANTQIPQNPTLFLSYARGNGDGTYKNFVRLENQNPVILDGSDVYFGPVKVAMPGDADGNGRVTFRDINVVKANIGNANAPCYTDCDGNGQVTFRDINCVKSKL